jgi:hypothetical protein
VYIARTVQQAGLYDFSSMVLATKGIYILYIHYVHSIFNIVRPVMCGRVLSAHAADYIHQLALICVHMVGSPGSQWSPTFSQTIFFFLLAFGGNFPSLSAVLYTQSIVHHGMCFLLYCIIVYCFLSSLPLLPHQPPRPCLAPTCHLSALK